MTDSRGSSLPPERNDRLERDLTREIADTLTSTGLGQHFLGTDDERFPPLDGDEYFPPLDGDEYFPPLDGDERFPPLDGDEYFPPLDGEVPFPHHDDEGLFPLLEDEDNFPSPEGEDFTAVDQNARFPPHYGECFPFLHDAVGHKYAPEEEECLGDDLLSPEIKSHFSSPGHSANYLSHENYNSFNPQVGPQGIHNSKRKRILERGEEESASGAGTSVDMKCRKTESQEFRAGGIHRKRQEWLSQEPTILTREFICNGYFIPFMARPKTSLSCKNRKSAEKHAAFVSEQIAGLLRTGAVEEVEEKQSRDKIACISPLSVAEGKKLRLVLDLSELNESVEKHHFKLEDARTVLPCLPEGGFLACFDLKSGYHHLLVAENSRRYLGFRWGGNLFRFAALPFGLSSAPFAFTKLMRTLVRKWRAEGLGCCLYLDDGLIWGPTRGSCSKAVTTIRRDLKDFGFTCAEEKCTWEPTQCLTWLGFEFNLRTNTVALSNERWEKSKKRLKALVNDSSPTLRDRLKWTGTLASMEILLSVEDKRNSREATAAVARLQESGARLDRKERVEDRERREWLWWEKRLERRPSRPIVAAPEQNSADTVLLTDASETGVGAVLKLPRYDVKTFAELPEHLQGSSSTLRELFGIVFGLGALRHRIKGDVVVKTDNWAATKIWKSGSLKPQLQDMARRIWDLEKENKWNLRVDWIPRALNSEADAASREIDYDDWRIRSSVATRIQEEWGQCEMDLFANDRNAKCHRFISRWPCPGSLGEDAFSRDDYWTSEIIWLVPPIKLVPTAIAFAVRLRAKGILGVPHWEGQPFFPMLMDERGNWRKGIEKTWYFNPGDILFENISFSKTFDSPETKVPFIFLKFNFSEQQSVCNHPQ